MDLRRTPCRTVSTVLPRELAARIDALAREARVKRSAVLRYAIATWLREDGELPPEGTEETTESAA